MAAVLGPECKAGLRANVIFRIAVAKKESYKEKTTVKTTAERIAEAMEARDAQARAEREAEVAK